jgi:hypothetical protein
MDYLVFKGKHNAGRYLGRKNMFWQETIIYIIKAVAFFAALCYMGGMIWLINFPRR